MRRFAVGGLALILVIACMAASACAAGFSADVVSSSLQGAFQGKIYVDNDKVRMELPMAVTITRADKRTAYVLMPGQKMYVEQQFDPRNVAATKEKIDGELERTLIGPDQVDGQAAQKYKVSYASEGVTGSIYQWMRDGVAVPVKTAAIDGSWSIEYRNLKVGDQSADLFEVPSGYRKFSYGNIADTVRNAIGGSRK